MVALTIGNFDGVHAGHEALVRRCRELVGADGRVVALAFDPHPASRLKPGSEPARLSSFEQRAAHLRAAGADEVERLEPTPDLLARTPEEFVRAKVDRHRPSFIVEGSDFHFGKGRAGNVRTLDALGARFGFRAIVVPPVEVALSDHFVVRASSTVVRWLLANGRVHDASLVLGRAFELDGAVVQGDRRGRTIGFPTANLETELMLPADGVYAATAHLPDGSVHPAALNVGERPTFNARARRVEVHLIRSDAGPWSPLPGLPEYGWRLRVRLVAWLRDQVRFASVRSLAEQLGRDCERAVALARPPLPPHPALR